MPLDEKMRLVLVQMTHPWRTIAHSLTPIASCTQWALAPRYFPEAMDFMPLPRRPGFETGARVDTDSIMLYHSSIARAIGAPSYPLLTARGSIINSGGNPDPNRAGLSRGDIERVMQLYPKRRAAPRQASGEQPEKQVAKRWQSIPFDADARPGQSKAWPVSDCDFRTHITYCYENQASQDTLSDLFAEGLAKWERAILQSSLVFSPDAACGTDISNPCLCDMDGILDTSVHIILGDPRVTWPESTIGYTAPSITQVYRDMPRYFIIWPADAGKFGARSPLFMAQQIGKAPR
jgi:hypothetical protein